MRKRKYCIHPSDRLPYLSLEPNYLEHSIQTPSTDMFALKEIQHELVSLFPPHIQINTNLFRLKLKDPVCKCGDEGY